MANEQIRGQISARIDMGSVIDRLADDPVSTTDYRPDHIPGLDGLRGAAALAVVMGHLTDFDYEVVPHQLGSYGVLLFFSLSGFLMGHLYLAKMPSMQRVVRYVAARISRIVPLYFITVIASFLIFHFFDAAFFYKVTAIQLLRLLTFNSSLSVFWSVGPEFQFYGAFLLLWLCAYLDRIKKYIALQQSFYSAWLVTTMPASRRESCSPPSCTFF